MNKARLVTGGAVCPVKSWASVGSPRGEVKHTRTLCAAATCPPAAPARYDAGVLPALVLAAGDSTRMGTPKATLRLPGGRSFIAQIVASLAEAGVADVTVVTGRHHDEVAAAVAAAGLPLVPALVRNPDPGRGQLSSLWVGLDAVLARTPAGLIVTLVDVPLVRAATIRRLIDVWHRTLAPVVRPAVGARHGHPVIFDARVFAELRAASPQRGAKAVISAHADAVVDVPVDDEGCLADIDTPDDYARISRS